MIKRLWHFLKGHEWKELTRSFQPGTGSDYGHGYYDTYTESRQRQCYGFTSVVEACYCGRVRERLFTGKHGTFQKKIDGELASLRKMAGIE